MINMRQAPEENMLPDRNADTVQEGTADVLQNQEMTPDELKAEVQRQKEISLQRAQAEACHRFGDTLRRSH